MKCINCGANPLVDLSVILRRINPKGIKGEWICDMCLKSMETFEDKPHYVHSATCSNYCDYACNGQRGFDLAEQVKEHLNDGKEGGK